VLFLKFLINLKKANVRYIKLCKSVSPQYYLFNKDTQYKGILAWHTAYKLQNHNVLEQHLEDDTEKVIHMYITQHRNSSNNFNMNNHQPESLQQNSY